MAEHVIDFEGMRFSFADNSTSVARTKLKQTGNGGFYIGQVVRVIVILPLTEEGKNKLKLPHPPRSPVSLNLKTSFMRLLSSSVEVKCNIISSIELHVQDNTSYTDNDIGEQWIHCAVVASNCETQFVSNLMSSQNEPFLSKDHCFYHVPVQITVPDIPVTCHTAQLQVQARPANRNAPSWLSSPTRPDTTTDICLTDGENSDIQFVKGKKVTQKIQVIHPPIVKMQQKSVAEKHMIFLQVHNLSHYSIQVDECIVLPDTGGPKATCTGCASKPGQMSHRNKCDVHSNLVKLIPGQGSMFPISLVQGECYSLCYNINTDNITETVPKHELILETHIQWSIPTLVQTGPSTVLTTYRLPMLRLKQALFVMNATMEDVCVKKGESFTVVYNITNRLQDFLAIKLHWNPVLTDQSDASVRQLDNLSKGVVCQDPCLKLGPCSYGSNVQVKVRFHALTTGLFEVCKHMKINLRYMIPGSETPSLASPTSQTSEDHLAVMSEELWRSRSGSGSSFNDPRIASAEERRLSFANKSYSFGDLGPTKSSDSDLTTKQKCMPPDRSPTRCNKDNTLNASTSSKYEQQLLCPTNFAKNSCLVYVM